MAKGYTTERTKWVLAHSFWLVFTWVPFGFLSWLLLFISQREHNKEIVFGRAHVCGGCSIRSFYCQNVPLRFGNEGTAYRLDHLDHTKQGLNIWSGSKPYIG
ncbi:hypothetical protein P8850_14860 [Bacillus inaquosorum]|uniref:hypothetical protein n=1 Tax=Bacillus inaquosorum TaxID=483913 RepID=UPI00227DF68F|nr:hypothetical protein [Bacillus inaquosorum]MCY8725137.1 hypothetical protein [Bacillus inaquosorum]MCY8789807.1 hypothetical protein [Bacillus inaquosorum]MCY9031932.1 hypothetical protein [Bacillus inaquosorum]MEC0639077.1 hypothetical protein [Bacillus inaquosorum]